MWWVVVFCVVVTRRIGHPTCVRRRRSPGSRRRRRAAPGFQASSSRPPRARTQRTDPAPSTTLGLRRRDCGSGSAPAPGVIRPLAVTLVGRLSSPPPMSAPTLKPTGSLFCTSHRTIPPPYPHPGVVSGRVVRLPVSARAEQERAVDHQPPYICPPAWPTICRSRCQLKVGAMTKPFLDRLEDHRQRANASKFEQR